MRQKQVIGDIDENATTLAAWFELLLHGGILNDVVEAVERCAHKGIGLVELVVVQ